MMRWFESAGSLLLLLLFVACSSTTESGTDSLVGEPDGRQEMDSLVSIPDALVEDLADKELRVGDQSGDQDEPLDLVEPMDIAVETLEDSSPDDGTPELIGDLLQDVADDQGGCIDTYPGQVLITELMLDPLAASGQSGQYIELLNTSIETLHMTGWMLVDGAGNSVSLTLPEGSSFLPYQRLILGFEASPGDNGGIAPDLLISGVDLSGGLLTIQAGETTVDTVNYSGDGWPRVAGASMSLSSDKELVMLNDLPESWCSSTLAYGAGDLGTPGLANPVCPLLPACGNGITEEGEDCDDGANGNDLDGCTDLCSLTCSNPELNCQEVPGDCRKAVCVIEGEGQVCGLTLDSLDAPEDTPCQQGSCLLGEPTFLDMEDGTGCETPLGVVGQYCVGGQCSIPVCGDGIRGPTEECDDGNQESGDGCGFDCVGEVSCPDDMVLIPAQASPGVEVDYCMDRYEASRQDATATDAGVDDSIAVSRAGVLPWFMNPFPSDLSLGLQKYQGACASAGKRLCSREEWFAACTGSGQTTYVWGNDWNPETCNCVDTFCDDYCADHPEISPCSTAYNCGYTYYSFHLMPTGSFETCRNEWGVYDVNGNLWEIVPSDVDPQARGFEVRGGAFNCGGPATRLECTFNANWLSLYAGFRCCKDLVEPLPEQ